MGKVGITAVLESQLESANATISQLMSQMDRMAALPPKQPHEVYRNLLPDRWSL